MKSKLTIIGASGHGKVVADIARLNGYKEIVFLDDNKDILECAGYPVIGDTSITPEGDVFVAVGNAMIRRTIMDRLEGFIQPVLIHPSAVIAKGVKIDAGSVVMAGAVINPEVKLGRGCIVNTSSSIDHDCIIGDFVHVAVGAHVCGTVTIGDSVWIGAGATIINNVTICGDCLIGAGALVIHDIINSGTFIGVPACRINHKD